MSDLVSWSTQNKDVHQVELTVPNENNFDAAQIWKMVRIKKKLVKKCENVKWLAKHFPAKIGCSGDTDACL